MMSNTVMTLLLVVFAFVLSPGVLVTIPPGCDVYTTALFHAILLAIVWALLKNPIYNALYGVQKTIKKKL